MIHLKEEVFIVSLEKERQLENNFKESKNCFF